MKRMITAIAVLLVVGGAFAFTPKEQNVCFYKRSGSTCPLNARPESFTIVSTTGGDEFVQNENPGGNCASSVALSLCNDQIDIVLNQ